MTRALAVLTAFASGFCAGQGNVDAAVLFAVAALCFAAAA